MIIFVFGWFCFDFNVTRFNEFGGVVELNYVDLVESLLLLTTINGSEVVQLIVQLLLSIDEI